MLKRLLPKLKRVDAEALSILVVADDVARTDLADALSSRVYTRVTFCGSIDEAATYLSESMYDAVLVTDRGAEPDVVSAVSILGEYASGAPIVLLTDEDDEALATEANPRRCSGHHRGQSRPREPGDPAGGSVRGRAPAIPPWRRERTP